MLVHTRCRDLPAESETDRNHGRGMRAGIHVVIASLREKLYLAATQRNRESHATVHSAFIDGIRLQNLIGRHVHRKENAEERIKAGDRRHGWSRKLDGAMVKPSTTDDVRVETVRWRKVDHGVEREGPHAHRAVREIQIVQSSSVDAQVVEVELRFHAQKTRLVNSRPSLDV